MADETTPFDHPRTEAPTGAGEADGNATLLRIARERYQKGIDADRDNREKAIEDLDFRIGAQWPAEIVMERDRDNRPCLTINRMPQFVRQVTGDIRQNTPAIKMRPADSVGDEKIADIYSGLTRHIQSVSDASIAYVTAAESAANCGIGHFRIVSEYIADDSFDQEIKIKRMVDFRAVTWDPDAIEPTRSDAMWCFVEEELDHDTFKARYPNASSAGFDFEHQETYNFLGNWFTRDIVRVAEYWTRTPEQAVLALLDDGRVIDATGMEVEVGKTYDAGAKEGSITIQKLRNVVRYRVEMRLMTGTEVLEGPFKVPGRFIPVIPVIGEEVFYGRHSVREGVIRHAKDSQRMYNFWAALDLATPLPTPSGWTTMGDVREGELLLDENGKPVKVIGKSPVYVHSNCFEITFDDGTSIVADAGHKWKVEERGKRKASTWDWSEKVLATDELRVGKHYIWCAKPLDLPEIDLPVHPYVLGVWLGDGTAASARITAGKADMAEMRRNIEACGYRTGDVGWCSDGSAGTFNIKGLAKTLSALGLLGNKHIPDIYLRASREQREALLQGLMDTDGSFAKGTKVLDFTNVNGRIVTAFAELLRGLGYKAKMCRREGKAKKFPNGNVYITRECTQFYFQAPPDRRVFRLSRKRAAHERDRVTHPRRTQRHAIISVRRASSVPVQCVAVDSDTHLYLAGESMVPTHNSAITEHVALQPKAPWLVTAANINGYEAFWKQANTRNLPYLPYKADKDNNGAIPQRNAPPAISQGMAELMGLADQDMKATTGIYDASLGNKSNEQSGRAIIARQREGDVSTYSYADNLTRALRHAGRIIIDWIPAIYDTEREIRILGEDGNTETVKINQLITDPTTGKTHKVNDLTIGRYDVVVTTGPSYSTRRAEASDAMIQFVQAVPQMGQAVMDLIAKYQDWPGADEIAKRLRKMLPPGIAEPGPDEPPPPPQPPDPKVVQAVTEAKTAAAKAESDSKTADANAELLRAQAEGQVLDNLAKEMALAAQGQNLAQLVQDAVRATLLQIAQNPDSALGGNGDAGAAPPQPAAPQPQPAPPAQIPAQ